MISYARFSFSSKTYTQTSILKPCELLAKSIDTDPLIDYHFLLHHSFVRCDEIVKLYQYKNVNTFSPKISRLDLFIFRFLVGCLFPHLTHHSRRWQLIKCRLSLGAALDFGFCLTSFLFEQQRSYDVINNHLMAISSNIQ